MAIEDTSNGIQRTLGKLEASVDLLGELLREHTKQDAEHFGRLERLILESRDYPRPVIGAGRAATWGATAAAVVAGVVEAFKRFVA